MALPELFAQPFNVQNIGDVGNFQSAGRAILEGSLRKRAGVEPTKARLTSPAGFEDRPPHRGTISSITKRVVQTVEIKLES